MSIRKYEDGTTDADIIKMLGFRPPIFMYKSLSRFIDKPEKFFSILKKNKMIFILYPTLSSYDGHWCLFIENKYGIIFFDSYGLDIDHEKHLINPINLIMGDSLVNFLKIIFINTPYTYNKYPFQLLGDEVNTCGYWCVHRAIFKHLSNEDYTNFVLNSFRLSRKKNKNINTLDDWILFNSLMQQ